MKYVKYLNQLIKEKVSSTDKLVIFGQNVGAGSCLSGLTRGLKINPQSMILNTPNSENTLTGLGFGLMLNGVNSIFFLKQQDFLLLGIDHLVNTYNFVRRNNPNASFTIFTPVIDCGYQGLQSSFNSFSDLCSIARVPGFAITNKIDAEKIINSQLISPGFRIIGVSQRLYSEEILEPSFENNESEELFCYNQGKDATIVCFNFSFPQGFELFHQMKKQGLNSSLFTVNSLTEINWKKIIDDVSITKNLIILDDSKSVNRSYNSLLAEVLSKVSLKNKIVLCKDMSKEWLSPNKDLLVVDYSSIIKKIGNVDN